MSGEIATQANVDVNTDQVGGTPYVTFFSPKSPKAGDYKLIMPSVKEPDPIMVPAAPYTPFMLSRFDYFLVAAKQVWLDAEDDGAINRVSYVVRDDGFMENIEAVLIVLHDGRMFPARATFRTTKCNGPRVSCKALKLADNNDGSWAKQSAAHAATLQIPFVWGRFVSNLTCQQRTAKQSGRKYFLSQVTIKPTTPDQVSALAAALKNDGFKRDMAAVVAAFESRLSHLAEHAVSDDAE
jgi:hypothetical protein